MTVETADLGPARITAVAARLTAVDAIAQTARATEYRAARGALDAAILACRLAWAFEAMRGGQYVAGDAYQTCRHVRERRSHAIHLRTHAGRIRALTALTDYVRKI